MTLMITQAELLEPVWHEVQQHTKPMHVQAGSCDIEVRTATVHCSRRGVQVRSPAASGTVGLHVTGTCHCAAVFVDALVCADLFLRKGLPLANPAGAVRHHVRLRLPDLYRQDRVRQGAQAKPRTVRRNRYGKAMPDDFLRTLFVLVVDEAGKPDPLDGVAHLHSRLAQRCATELGGTAADYLPRIPVALSLVERICRTGRAVNVGTRAEPELVTWWDAYVVIPLGRRPPSYRRLWYLDDDDTPAEIPDPSATEAFDLVVAERSVPRSADDLADASEVALVVGVLVATVGSARPGHEEFAVRRAIADLADLGVLDVDVATALLGDERRMEAVLASLHDLNSGHARVSA